MTLAECRKEGTSLWLLEVEQQQPEIGAQRSGRRGKRQRHGVPLQFRLPPPAPTSLHNHCVLQFYFLKTLNHYPMDHPIIWMGSGWVQPKKRTVNRQHLPSPHPTVVHRQSSAPSRRVALAAGLGSRVWPRVQRMSASETKLGQWACVEGTLVSEEPRSRVKGCSSRPHSCLMDMAVFVGHTRLLWTAVTGSPLGKVESMFLL